MFYYCQLKNVTKSSEKNNYNKIKNLFNNFFLYNYFLCTTKEFIKSFFILCYKKSLYFHLISKDLNSMPFVVDLLGVLNYIFNLPIWQEGLWRRAKNNIKS